MIRIKYFSSQTSTGRIQLKAVKETEEQNRIYSICSILTAVRFEQKLLKQMKQYLSVDANKKKLIDFL